MEKIFGLVNGSQAKLHCDWLTLVDDTRAWRVITKNILNSTTQSTRGTGRTKNKMNCSESTTSTDAEIIGSSEAAYLGLQDIFGTSSDSDGLLDFSTPIDLDDVWVPPEGSLPVVTEDLETNSEQLTQELCAAVFPGWEAEPPRHLPMTEPVVASIRYVEPEECPRALVRTLLLGFHQVSEHALQALSGLRNLRTTLETSEVWFHIRAWAFWINQRGWQTVNGYAVQVGSRDNPVNLSPVLQKLQRRSTGIRKTIHLRRELCQMGFNMLVTREHSKARLGRRLAEVLLGIKIAGWADELRQLPGVGLPTEITSLVALINQPLPTEQQQIFAEGSRFEDFLHATLSSPHVGHRRNPRERGALMSTVMLKILRLYEHLVKVAECLAPPAVTRDFELYKNACYGRTARGAPERKQRAEEAFFEATMELADRRATIVLQQHILLDNQEIQNRRQLLRQYLEGVFSGILQFYRPPGVAPRRLREARPLTPTPPPDNRYDDQERRRHRLGRRLRRQLQVNDAPARGGAAVAATDFNRGIQMMIDNIHILGDERVRQWLGLFSTGEQGANTSTENSDDDATAEIGSSANTSVAQNYSRVIEPQGITAPSFSQNGGVVEPQGSGTTPSGSGTTSTSDATVVPDQGTRYRPWNDYTEASPAKRHRRL